MHHVWFLRPPEGHAWAPDGGIKILFQAHTLNFDYLWEAAHLVD